MILKVNKHSIWVLIVLMLAAGNGAAKGTVLCFGTDGHVSVENQHEKDCCFDTGDHCHSDTTQDCYENPRDEHASHSCADIPVWINSLDIDIVNHAYSFEIPTAIQVYESHSVLDLHSHPKRMAYKTLGINPTLHAIHSIVLRC